MSQIDEVCVKEPQCCEIFDRFCFGCREIQILKTQQSYRERLRRLVVVPAREGCSRLRTIAHNYTPDFLEAMEELSKLYQAWNYKEKKGLGYFASWIWRREMEHLKSQVITRVEDIDSERKCDVGFGLMFKEFIETGKINDLEEMRLKLSHNYTPDFLEALEELIELYQARALKSKKAAFRSSVWREEMRTLEWKVITRVEDIDSDTWESDLGLGQKFKEFIKTGSFKRLEEMRGVISQPAGTTHYSIAYNHSIAGVITPTWQVWDAVTGIGQSDQLTMQTNTGVRAPSFPEAIKTVSYSGWYSESGGIYTYLGRKS